MVRRGWASQSVLPSCSLWKGAAIEWGKPMWSRKYPLHCSCIIGKTIFLFHIPSVRWEWSTIRTKSKKDDNVTDHGQWIVSSCTTHLRWKILLQNFQFHIYFFSIAQQIERKLKAYTEWFCIERCSFSGVIEFFLLKKTYICIQFSSACLVFSHSLSTMRLLMFEHWIGIGSCMHNASRKGDVRPVLLKLHLCVACIVHNKIALSFACHPVLNFIFYIISAICKSGCHHRISIAELTCNCTTLH